MNNNNIKDFLLNPNSMTKILKSLGSDFKINIISHEFINDYFFRYTNIYLDDLLIMSNISYTNINHKKFLGILVKSKKNSIGIELFNPINNIKRESMIVDYFDQNALDNNYFNSIKGKIKEKNEFIIERKSVFSYNHEKMFLCEYITEDFIEFISNKM